MRSPAKPDPRSPKGQGGNAQIKKIYTQNIITFLNIQVGLRIFEKILAYDGVNLQNKVPSVCWGLFDVWHKYWRISPAKY